MKEIEILVEVYEESEKILNTLHKFNYIGIVEVIDEYYYDPMRNDLKPDDNKHLSKCLRLRIKNNKYFVTYKEDIFNGEEWLYSNEHETEIENIDVFRNILLSLGYKQLLVINNKKHTYLHEKYEIVFEDVKDLGYFLEVEYCSQDEDDVIEIKKDIQTFIDSLSLAVSKELNMGKPELFLRKNNLNLD